MTGLTVPLGAAVLFSLGGTLIVAAGIITYVMIGKVNRKLPDDQQIGYVFFYPTKAFRIAAEYRRLYPGSRLNMIRIILLVSGFILGACSAAQMSRVWH